MARVSNTLIGAASGRVGNAVFSTWKGINVLKEKPASVANPNTDNQIMRRSALSQMVSAFRQMPSAIRAGFKKLAVGKSEWNAFASYNLRNSFDFSAPPAADIVLADVLVSKGTIAATTLATAVADVSLATIVCTFNATVTAPGQSLTDKALICAYNIDQDDWTGATTADLRSAGTADIPLPAGWIANDDVQVYLAFYNETSGESSDSETTAIVVIA